MNQLWILINSTGNGIFIYFQILHAAGQINIVRYWLTQLTASKDENKDGSIAMTKIIQKHNKIIRFTKHIECLYTYSTLMIFVTNTILICVLAFLVVTVSKIIIYKLIVFFYYN